MNVHERANKDTGTDSNALKRVKVYLVCFNFISVSFLVSLEIYRPLVTLTTLGCLSVAEWIIVHSYIYINIHIKTVFLAN